MFPPIHSRTRRHLILLACCATSWLQPTHSILAADEAGEIVFKQKCAQCHGSHGQGAAGGYENPLRGEQTVVELTHLIEETMPEDNPEECVGDEARQVAEYIRKHFFSQTPRLELARLTVDQHRNAIADVIGRFALSQLPRAPGVSGGGQSQPRPQEPTLPGLRGEYYQSRGTNKADRLGHYCSDTYMDFDFGESGPVPTISADQFSIIWEGGLVANDTGHYEFRISTPNGARLYINLDPRVGQRKLNDFNAPLAGQQALIDDWVGSGTMRERSARIFLLGGRTYAIRFEFFKYFDKTASVKLEWKPPHGIWSVIDYNDTTTHRPPRVFVSKTPFPADDHSLGYERGTSISPEWQTATSGAAVEAATEVVRRLPLLAGLTEETEDRDNQVTVFVLRFASVAFRRPLTRNEESTIVDIMTEDGANLETRVRNTLVMVLMSPQFLYTDLTPTNKAPSQYAVAARLAFALWDSIPDQELIDAAASGELATEEQIETQARRMLPDPRTKAKMRNFFRNWLGLEERDLAKDKEMFPEFSEAIIADLRRSLELFIERVVWSRESDYRQLLQSEYLVLNQQLRELYEAEAVKEELDFSGRAIKARNRRLAFASEFQPVKFPADQRSGVLTHPYLLSAYAYHNNTSPIHRGVFLTRTIVGRALNPPPIAVAFKDDEFALDLTMREKITQLTRDTACMSCHSVINPLGFTLESFDSVGRWRTIDNNKPVDTKSQYTTAAGEMLEFESARDIANFAVSSEAAHRTFTVQVFRHIVKQDPMAFDTELLERLRLQFADDDFNVQNLWARIAVVTAAHDPTDSPSAE